MRMTMNLPDSILEDALTLAGTANKTTVIVTALEEYVNRKRREGLKSLVGSDVLVAGYDPVEVRKWERDEADPGR